MRSMVSFAANTRQWMGLLRAILSSCSTPLYYDFYIYFAEIQIVLYNA